MGISFSFILRSDFKKGNTCHCEYIPYEQYHTFIPFPLKNGKYSHTQFT